MALALLKKPAVELFTVEWLDHVVYLNEQFKEIQGELAECKTHLVERGPHRYACSGGHEINVIYPAPKISTLKGDAVALMRKLLGKLYPKLYVEEIVAKPVSAARHVATAILEPTKQKKYFAVAEEDCPAQVRIN